MLECCSQLRSAVRIILDFQNTSKYSFGYDTEMNSVCKYFLMPRGIINLLKKKSCVFPRVQKINKLIIKSLSDSD